MAALWSMTPAKALPLSPGDRIEVSIPNEKYFARIYEINQAGNLEVPFIGDLAAVGKEPSAVAQALRQRLVSEGYFPANALNLSVQVILLAPVAVGESGDVFSPGATTINGIAEESEKTGILPEVTQVTGDFAPGRFLTDALRAAGGIRPTADIKNIRVVRGTETLTVDLSGVFTGRPIRNIPLIAGDQVIVPVSTAYQPELVRPSLITPPGIRVIVSNLTVPAFNNSSASISNRSEGITFVYGSRFSHAVAGANCVGGTKTTNASRRAVLVRVNHRTGETIAFERSIEDLIRNSKSDRDNPFLLRADTVACYDSKVTDVRDIFNSLGDVFAPIRLIQDIFF